MVFSPKKSKIRIDDLDVSSLKSVIGREEVYSFDEAADHFDFDLKDVVFLDPIRGEARLVNRGDEIHCEISFETRVRLICFRCLEPFEIPFRGSHEVEFYEKKGFTEHEVELKDEDLGSSWYKDKRVDLLDEIRQGILLALPSNPLCKPTCQGLCPNCGANLNRERCACKSQSTDPRFSKLEALLSEEGEGNGTSKT
jgi:uncharacterized protein